MNGIIKLMNAIDFLEKYRESKSKSEDVSNLFKNEIFPNSFFVIDANSLLYTLKDYRTTNKIFAALNKLGEKTYIPFITQNEYLRNKEKTIQSTKDDLRNYCEFKKHLNQFNSQSDDMKPFNQEKLFSEDKLEDFVFNNLLDKNNLFKTSINQESVIDSTDRREYYIKPILDYREALREELKVSYNEIFESIKAKLSDKIGEFNKKYEWDDSDLPKLDKLNELEEGLNSWFNDVELGKSYTFSQLENFKSIIDRRYSEKISPGYMDIKKDDRNKKSFIQLGSLIIESKYGDALFWLDILDFIKNNEVITDKYKYLVIISEETKKDWVGLSKEDWEKQSEQRKKEKGKDTMLNYDMVQECVLETGLIPIKLNMIELVNYLIGLTPEQIDDAKEFQGTKFQFSLYSWYMFYPSDLQEMLKSFMEVVLPKFNLSDSAFEKINCLKEWKGDSPNKIQIKGKDYDLDPNVSIEEALQAMYIILEDRVWGSSGQLKFMDEEIKKLWKKVRQGPR